MSRQPSNPIARVGPRQRGSVDAGTCIIAVLSIALAVLSGVLVVGIRTTWRKQRAMDRLVNQQAAMARKADEVGDCADLLKILRMAAVFASDPAAAAFMSDDPQRFQVEQARQFVSMLDDTLLKGASHADPDDGGVESGDRGAVHEPVR